MKNIKRVLFIFALFMCVFTLGKVSAANTRYDFDVSKLSTSYVDIRFISGIATPKQAFEAGLTDAERSWIYGTTSKTSTVSGYKTWSISRGKQSTKDAYQYYSTYSSTKYFYNLPHLSNVTVNGISYEFDGWYYDANFTKPVTVDNIVDIAVLYSQNISTYGRSLAKTSTSEQGVNEASVVKVFAKWKTTSTKPSCSVYADYDKQNNTSSSTDKRPKLYLAATSMTGTEAKENIKFTIAPSKAGTSTAFISNVADHKTVAYARSSNLTIPTPAAADMEKSGYRFEGWYYDSLYTKPVTATKYSDILSTWEVNDVDVNGCATSYADVYLYPRWTYIEDEVSSDYYTINLDANGGTLSGANTIMRPKKTAASYDSLKKPTRDGYHFDGWYYDKNLTNRVSGSSANDVSMASVIPLYNYANKNGAVYKLFAKWSRLFTTANGTVRIYSENNMIPTVKEITSSEKTLSSSLISTNKIVKYKAYDIKLLNDSGATVQPYGYINIEFDIPSGYDAGKVQIYYLDESGSTPKLVKPSNNQTIVDNVANTSTNHFSTYVLAEVSDVNNTNVVTTKDSDSSLKTLKVVGGETIPLTTGKVSGYSISVSNTTTSVTFEATANSSNAKGIDGLTCNISSKNYCNIVVTAEDDSKTTYVIDVVKNNSSLNTASTLSKVWIKNIADTDTNIGSDTTYTIKIPNNATLGTIQFGFTGTNSNVHVKNDSCNISELDELGSISCPLVSYAENENYHTEYTFKIERVNRVLDSKKIIQSLIADIKNSDGENVESLWNVEFNSDVTSYFIVVPNSVDKITFKATPNDRAKLSVDDKTYNTGEMQIIQTKSLSVGMNLLQIKVIAEDSSSQVYSFYIVKASSENISNIIIPPFVAVVKGENVPISIIFGSDNLPVYKIEVGADVDTVTFDTSYFNDGSSITSGATCSINNYGDNTCNVTTKKGTVISNFVINVIKTSSPSSDITPVTPDVKPSDDSSGKNEKNSNTGAFVTGTIICLVLLFAGVVVAIKFKFKNTIFKI